MGRKKRLAPELTKYYRYRHDLFSLFDEGIKLTNEQWYSVTPEPVAVTTANYISERYPLATTVVDGFGGAGGNTIQFAYSGYFQDVFYNDCNSTNTDLALHNSEIYDVSEWIYFLTEDFFDLTKGDFFEEKGSDDNMNTSGSTESSNSDKSIVIFASPPWGGPSYTSNKVWDLATAEPSVFDIVRHSRTITNQICLFLPRTSNLDQISELAEDDEEIFVDYVFMSGRCKGMLVFLGCPPRSGATGLGRAQPPEA